MKNQNLYKVDIKFADLKEMFKKGDWGEEFNSLSLEILDYLGELTFRGIPGDTKIEGITIDLWKDRVFHLIERAGLLPEYTDIDEEEEEVQDDWYKNESDDWDFGDAEPILTKIEKYEDLL